MSGLASLLDYEGRWIAETRGGTTTVWTEVGVPVKTLCPCSKEISRFGAHNQRCEIEARVRFNGTLWIEDLVRIRARSEELAA